jgi:hypothetical protein
LERLGISAGRQVSWLARRQLPKISAAAAVARMERVARNPGTARQRGLSASGLAAMGAAQTMGSFCISTKL